MAMFAPLALSGVEAAAGTAATAGAAEGAAGAAEGAGGSGLLSRLGSGLLSGIQFRGGGKQPEKQTDNASGDPSAGWRS